MPSSLFNYFNVYRVVIAGLLLGMTLSKGYTLSDFRDASSFQFTAGLYFFISLVSLLLYRFRLKAEDKQQFVSVLIDLGFLHVLFYFGEGITGGISNLVIISVAAANIMLRGSKAYALAAIASLLSLGLELERMIHGYSGLGDVARAGIAGSVYFAAAVILQNVARRILQSEELAEKQEKDIAELQALNHQIIQSMRTGIIVCDANSRVKVFNQACTDLLGMKDQQSLPSQLVSRVTSWRNSPSIRTKPFQVSPELPMVQANFSNMEGPQGDQTLIFLEDTRLLSQQAQQLKLASLGRLTASIAHEVRNPLGAISHATQLLSESDSLDAGDRKMTDIIERHCLRVNNIIENTLTLSRRGKPEIREMKVLPWLEKVIESYRTNEETKSRVRLSMADAKAKARFDPSQIEQVLTNLIDNALHHSGKLDPKSVVIVHLGRSEESSQTYIDVRDTGMGITKENQKHLFEPFFTTESKGTGLGLYISRELCEANQANLSYVDNEFGGACFKITFAHYKRIV